MKGYPEHATATLAVPSPVGELLILATEKGLAGIFFEKRITDSTLLPSADPEHPHLAATARQLEQYFAGERREFEIPLDLRGTDFQRSVWSELSRIPWGQTRSYRDIAESISNPRAVRAVGLANGSNPISIVVPCHRVIGADGSLTGYGGGLDRKLRLLALEGLELPILD